jgi:hypothetical protein
MGIINNLINSIKDNFTMAEFSINGRMTVKSLRKQFKDAFGASLRVYKGAKFAPEDATLASIRSGENVKGGELVCKGNLQVGNFEAKMKEMFGITVKVANPDNTKLASSNMTIAAAGREAVATDDWSNERLQCYFWDTLQDLLIAKGYGIDKKDFAQDVEDYYKSTRYKRYGITFNIYRTKKKKDVTFTIYTLEKYVYGIRYSGDVAKDKELEAAIDGVDPLISLNENWAGFGGPSPRYELNFKKMDSEGIGKLKNPTARAAFMNGVANEIDTLIKNLVEVFKKKGL